VADTRSTHTAPDRAPFVVVGGGVAGAHAAAALRAEGARGRIVLIGAEPDRPYNRPPLSKDFLRDETPRDRVYVHPPDWGREHDVELRAAQTVERLDLGARSVTLAGGAVVGYERLLLATGSAPRPLTVPGAGLEGVLLLRTLADAERIKRAARDARRVVMVGGGFIGAEVAASLRQKGLETTVVAREGVLWEHLFGAGLAGAFQRRLERGGVRVLTRDEVVRIEGDGRAERVVTAGGETLPCDLVVAGIGATPNTALLDGTGLTVERGGVVTDATLQTSRPGVYAAGDIARFYSPLYERHLRVEHWDVAIKQGTLAGRNMAREAAGHAEAREPFAEPPYFFSDLFDLAMEYLGHNEGWDDTVFRGDPAGDAFTGFYLRHGRLVAALFVNRNRDVGPTRTLIEQRLDVDGRARRLLGDPSADLRALRA
jgi:3-phenylpropionate/trans-cinnamate dioxygenase ferredoxin reductase subunit